MTHARRHVSNRRLTRGRHAYTQTRIKMYHCTLSFYVTSRMPRLPASLGSPTVTCRSNRPGRVSAGSSTSGRLVAATTNTLRPFEKRNRGRARGHQAPSMRAVGMICYPVQRPVVCWCVGCAGGSGRLSRKVLTMGLDLLQSASPGVTHGTKLLGASHSISK